jgi:hypothetical protein
MCDTRDSIPQHVPRRCGPLRCRPGVFTNRANAVRTPTGLPGPPEKLENRAVVVTVGERAVLPAARRSVHVFCALLRIRPAHEQSRARKIASRCNL